MKNQRGWITRKSCFFLSVVVWVLSGGPALSGTLDSGLPAPPGMVLIPAGEYLAGSEDFNDEKPAGEIYLDAFFIDAHEVTQADFKKVIGKNPSEFRGEDLPVERVPWYEARAYCEKSGKRLPTEAEWEKAARAGTDSRFYWGDQPDDAYAWHWDNAERRTHPVGQKNPNGNGLYDMAGNVGEWVADWYDAEYYRNRSQKNPQSPFNGKYRVLRGGSFMDKPGGLRVTRRNWDLPGARFKNFGFRCVRNTK